MWLGKAHEIAMSDSVNINIHDEGSYLQKIKSGGIQKEK